MIVSVVIFLMALAVIATPDVSDGDRQHANDCVTEHYEREYGGAVEKEDDCVTVEVLPNSVNVEAKW